MVYFLRQVVDIYMYDKTATYVQPSALQNILITFRNKRNGKILLRLWFCKQFFFYEKLYSIYFSKKKIHVIACNSRKFDCI